MVTKIHFFKHPANRVIIISGFERNLIILSFLEAEIQTVIHTVKMASIILMIFKIIKLVTDKKTIKHSGRR